MWIPTEITFFTHKNWGISCEGEKFSHIGFAVGLSCQWIVIDNGSFFFSENFQKFNNVTTPRYKVTN